MGSMDLVLTESFVAVAEAGIISAAAGELSISQSALSRRLQQLERELDVQLLIRSSDGVELTDAGRDVLSASRRLLDNYTQMRRNLADRDGLLHGRVRVGGGATATSYIWPACIAQLHSNHPGLQFYVRESGSRQVADDVAHGRLDVGIVTTPVDTEGIATQALFTDRVVLVAPQDDQWTRTPTRLRDLAGTPLIGFEPESAIRKLIDSALAAAGVHMKIVAELRSIPTMLHMVRETGIPAFVSRLGVQNQPGLAEITVRQLSITRKLAIATREDVDQTPATKAVIELLHTTRADRRVAGRDR